MKDNLKPKEKLFCYFYHKLGNGKEAYLKAGFSPVMISSMLPRLLLRNDILQEIAKYDKKRANSTLKSEVVTGLQRLAFGQVADCIKLSLCEKEDLLMMVDNMDLFHVSEMKIHKDKSIDIKFFDRFKALEMLEQISSSAESKNDANEFYKALEQSANIIGQVDGLDEV